MVKFGTILILLAGFASMGTAQEIRTVVAEGIGTDPQNAAQAAAQNALTNVVGTFIDTDTQLEKRSEIRDGIRSQTTQIRTDVKEYSQGSIQSFEVIETKKDGPFFRVTAKVGVRIDDFRAYIKKLAEGETTVGSGLFAEMSTAHKQSESIAKILSERILAVVNGEVIKFSVGKPIPFRRSRFADAKNQYNSGAIGRLAYGSSPDQLAVFEVTATLDEAFLSNFVQTLNSISASKKRVSTSGADSSGPWALYTLTGQCRYLGSQEEDSPRKVMAEAQRFGGTRPLSSFVGGILAANSGRGSNAPSNPSPTAGQADSNFCLPLLDRTREIATVYRFSNVDHELGQYLPWAFNIAVSIVRREIKLPTLEIAVLDKDQKELQVELNRRPK